MEQRAEYDIGGSGRERLAAGEDRCPDLTPSVVDHGISTMEVPMIAQLKRFQIQILLEAGHSQAETSRSCCRWSCFAGHGWRGIKAVRRR